MMTVPLLLLSALVGYLLGSISFARVIMRFVKPDVDVADTKVPIPGTEETFDMYAVSATSVSLQVGSKWGGITTLLDMLKVAAPVLAFRMAFPDEPYFLVCALMGTVGHNWPIFHRFKGGHGLSTVYGGVLAIDWIGALVTALGGMALGLLVLRNVIVAYLAGLWLLIPWFWIRTGDVWYIGYAVLSNVLFTVAMIPDIQGHLDRRRRGIRLEMQDSMELTPMGKHMMEITRRLGLTKDS
jgi:glycerol-3-phosphate acyltransferase PlsY